MPRTQTEGRGANAITEAAWASSLSMSASTQQHVPSPASGQHIAGSTALQRRTASGSCPQTGSPMQPNQSAKPAVLCRQQGPPRFSPTGDGKPESNPDLSAQQVGEGSLAGLSPFSLEVERSQTDAVDGNSQALHRSANLVPYPRGQTDHTHPAEHRGHTASISIHSSSATAQMQRAHAGPAHSAPQQARHLESVPQQAMHIVSAAPANAAQHLMGRPQASAKGEHMQTGPRYMPASREHATPGQWSSGVLHQARWSLWQRLAVLGPLT